MIKRYSREKMANVWSDQTKFQKWLDIEVAACVGHNKLGNIPDNDLKEIQDKANFDVKRIREIEAEINHDVIAFTTSVAEFIGPSSRFVHMGLTSTDVVDTALCLQIQDASTILLEDIDDLLSILKEKALLYKDTLCMGRTHGVHAEPTTFGLKLAVWFEEFKRNKERLEKAKEQLRMGLISGAVGNYANITPELEKLVCEELNLKPSPISTQTLQRDRHAEYITSLGIIAGTLDKMATEIRALQKTEFNEALEPFAKAQKGSSAMPHKRNPITCERISGLARTIRGNVVTALENQVLWHERDISHSSAERVIFPDATIGLDYMFGLMIRVLKDIVVNEDAMLKNIQASYNSFYSQPLLLLLVNKGITREKAYRIVQRNALSAFDNKTLFDEQIKTDEDIQSLLTKEEQKEIFSLDRYKKHTDMIFEKLGIL